MPELRELGLQSVQGSAGYDGDDGEETQLLEVREDLSLVSDPVLGGESAPATQPHLGRDEEEADRFFKEKARELGYLSEGGKGLWAFYRDNGILPPEYMRRVIPSKELTGTIDKL
jgi:hypothetical protein